MKEKQLTRRILQYIAGLVCMAVGLVLLKRTYWGVSPITAVPDAVTNVTHISLGNTTILLHILCVRLGCRVNISQDVLTVKSAHGGTKLLHTHKGIPHFLIGNDSLS